MIFGRTLSWIEKLAVFLAASLLVFYASLELRIWQTELGHIFLFTGRWEELLMLYGITLAVTYVLSKLLVWTFRMQFRRR